MSKQLTELEIIRRKKIEKYREININPFSQNFEHSDDSKTINEKYNSFSKDELQEKKIKISIVGRLMTQRGPFMMIKDWNGEIQAYIPIDELSKQQITLIDLLDFGDIVKIEGIVMKTNVGSLTIRTFEIKILTKSLKPLPEKFHGLKDIEERYRRRYVDLIMNDDVKQIFWTRTKIISLIRKFMDNLGYMEADTPILHSILGGAAAEPFITHHNALKMPFYLRIATEIPLKKILVGGIDRVYEIGRIFRNEGVDTTHNPEFTSIEFYEAYSNLEGMMKRTEDIFNFIANEVKNSTVLKYEGQEISLKTPFAKINMVDAISEATGKDFRNISLEEAKQVANNYKIKIEKFYKVGHIIAKLFDEIWEKKLIQPTFVIGHPIEVSPLAAVNEQDPRFTDRAELFIGGREYANMFTELNNPIEQLKRFEEQLKESKLGNKEANEIDIDFIEALEYGMPPAGGCGIGIDRLVMLFTDKSAIREVLMFPHLKNREGNNEK